MTNTLYKKIGDKIIQCLACRHYCKIAPEQTGICGVRQNTNGKLKLLVYGKAISANIDPVEKKPLFHFLPGSEIFSFGTIGCNFGCDFCQNWDISQTSKELKLKLIKDKRFCDLKMEIEKYGYDLKPKEIVEYCVKHKIPSIAYTYNEPSIFFEYTYDTAKLAYENGIKNVYVSNGYASKEAVDKIAPFLDGINIDLKGFTEDYYQKICKSKLSEVLESIKYYYRKKIWIEITTLLVPGKNDSDDEIGKIAEFIIKIDKNIPWHIIGFVPHYKMYNIPFTSDDSLIKACKIGKEKGLNFVYLGNTSHKELENTYCPNCSELLIERDWHRVNIKNIINGICIKCKKKMQGIWY